VQVADVVTVARRFGAELVRLAVAARLDAGAREPQRETPGVVAATEVALLLPRATLLLHRLATELAAPDDQRLVEQAGALEIGQQSVDRTIDFGAVDAEVLFDAEVRVPRLLLVSAAVVDLHATHAALQQPARDQALTAEGCRADRQAVVGLRVVHAVHALGRLGLLREVERFGRGLLHAISELIRSVATEGVAVTTARLEVFRVHAPDQIDLFALHRAREARARRARSRFEVEHGIAEGAEQRALVRRRHVTAGPVRGTRERSAALILHHHERRQVRIRRAETVSHPRA